MKIVTTKVDPNDMSPQMHMALAKDKERAEVLVIYDVTWEFEGQINTFRHVAAKSKPVEELQKELEARIVDGVRKHLTANFPETLAPFKPAAQ